MSKTSVKDIAKQLSRASEARQHATPSPSRQALSVIGEELRTILFAGYFGEKGLRANTLAKHLSGKLQKVMPRLQEQLRHAFLFHDPNVDAKRSAATAASQFLQSLTEIRSRLAKDVVAAFEGDPACLSADEAILAYPGIHALTYYRIAHELFRLEVPFIPRMLTEIAHSDTGIDIHPGAEIGEHFFIDHGTGVVIGATCVIKNRVRLYQGVTLGAKSFKLDDSGRPVKGVPRHPIIEDDVIIYAEATILGRVTIGKGAVIGGNVWVTEDVPAGARILQNR